MQFETKYFILKIPDEIVHVDREDGGHLIIVPRREMESRVDMTTEEAHEFIELSMKAGSALAEVLTKGGIEIGRVNYQENGNWTSVFHLHIYGRAKDAKIQKYGEALNFPNDKTFYEGNERLTKEDFRKIVGLISEG